MKKIFNFALVFAMTFSSAALYAQGTPASPAPQNNAPAAPAQNPMDQTAPTVDGNLEGMSGTAGLHPAAAIGLGVGVVAVAAAVAEGGSGGGSSGTTGTN